jgi:hypothetical protein
MNDLAPSKATDATAFVSEHRAQATTDRRQTEPEQRRTVEQQSGRIEERAARMVHLGAGVLALSVLADSGIEHYRGSFHNKAMFAPLVSSSLSLVTNAPAAFGARPPLAALDAVQGIAAVTGFAGLAFHAYNIGKRPGGYSWLNLFYAAPIGAPFALTLAGLFGRCAFRLARDKRRLFGWPAGRFLAWTAAAGMAGTVGEAGLLHFRGAYHHPGMFLPVTVPPVSAGLLAVAAASPGKTQRKAARGALYATAALGVAGVGFHLFGVWRNMGGFRNSSQNVLNGPPLPAPPSFLGLAFIGLAALALMEADND